jgi:hypothetical protein
MRGVIRGDSKVRVNLLEQQVVQVGYDSKEPVHTHALGSARDLCVCVCVSRHCVTKTSTFLQAVGQWTVSSLDACVLKGDRDFLITLYLHLTISLHAVALD